MAAYQAPPSLRFSRQEHWSGLPFSSPVHESEKWKWSHSVVSNSSWPHGLQPTRLLCPWDFPGKSTGVGCHCLLQWIGIKVYQIYFLQLLTLIILFMWWNNIGRFSKFGALLKKTFLSMIYKYFKYMTAVEGWVNDAAQFTMCYQYQPLQGSWPF